MPHFVFILILDVMLNKLHKSFFSDSFRMIRIECLIYLLKKKGLCSQFMSEWIRQNNSINPQQIQWKIFIKVYNQRPLIL